MPFYLHSTALSEDEITAAAQSGALPAYSSRADAHAAVTDPSAQKVSFVPSNDETQRWQDRENERFNDGTYIQVPWHDRYFASKHWKHYPHLSLKMPGMLAYTKNDEHGVQDRQTRVRPGRYLKEFYSEHLSEREIEELAAACGAAALEVHFAVTADEIEAVYTANTGPDSCMAKEDTDFQSACHPVRVYGDSDLQLAYIGSIEDGIIRARAIVWPERKIMGRRYGHVSLIGTLLREKGYTDGYPNADGRNDCMKGAHVRAILDGDTYVMPYVDGIGGARYIGKIDGRPGKWIRLGDGSLDTQRTDGLAGDRDTSQCEQCGDRYNDDEDAGDGLCGSCYQDRGTCEACDGYFSFSDSDTFERMSDGSTYCTSCADERVLTCDVDGCGDTWIEEQLTRAQRRRRQDSGAAEHLCTSCEDTHGYCTSCDAVYELATGCPTCREEQIDLPLPEAPAIDPLWAQRIDESLPPLRHGMQRDIEGCIVPDLDRMYALAVAHVRLVPAALRPEAPEEVPADPLCATCPNARWQYSSAYCQACAYVRDIIRSADPNINACACALCVEGAAHAAADKAVRLVRLVPRALRRDETCASPGCNAQRWDDLLLCEVCTRARNVREMMQPSEAPACDCAACARCAADSAAREAMILVRSVYRPVIGEF